MARVKARDQSKRLGSLLVNPGGPGASGIDYVRGGAETIGGPEVRTVRSLAEAYRTARGSHRPVMPLRLPGATFRAFRSGTALVPGEQTTTVTFEQFLAARDSLVP